jgi:hypothetical protein
VKGGDELLVVVKDNPQRYVSVGLSKARTSVVVGISLSQGLPPEGQGVVCCTYLFTQT